MSAIRSRWLLVVVLAGTIWALTLWGSRVPTPIWLGIPLWYWRAGGLLLLLIPLSVYGCYDDHAD